MGATKKTDRIAQLTAQVEALTSRLNALEAPVEADQNGNGHKAGPQTRRDLLKLAGAAAAGAAGTILLRTAPAAATSGMPVLLGNATTNDSAATTDLFPGRQSDDDGSGHRLDDRSAIPECPIDWRHRRRRSAA